MLRIRLATGGFFAAVGLLALGAGCGDDGGPGEVLPDNLCNDENALEQGLFDDDQDTIRNEDEGGGDVDGDGVPNFLDEDSDGDSLLDIDEVLDDACGTPPTNDLDSDGIPDFLDADGNGDGIPDIDQVDGAEDADGDTIPDFLDNDIDGDGILNRVELGLEGEPIDSDFDGVPDYLDQDSDGDFILDETEGTRDIDNDDIPNFRDLDSDGDGLSDVREAGDSDLSTDPVICDRELDIEWNAEEDGLPPEFESDTFPDFVDADSDNDGLTDGEEEALATDLCGWDTDEDGLSDLVEAAYERINCAAGPGAEGALGCGCALDPTCTIPESDFFVVLPFNGNQVVRELEFGTDVREADVFFLTDTTGSMGGTLDNVKTATGAVIETVNQQIPDAWFGGGQFDDFPMSGHGSTFSNDEPFILAIGMRPPEEASVVTDAFQNIERHGGSDGPESHTEAIYQLFTGEGGTWTNGSDVYTMPAYADDCLEGGFGAPCFREAALQVLVFFTDQCSHRSPPEETCGGYRDIAPEPATWNQAVFEMNRVGGKFIGVNAAFGECPENPEPGPPFTGARSCYYLTQTAEVTDSVDFAREPLVYDLPNASTPDQFANTISEAIERVTTNVPFDVDTTVRDDPSDPEFVDAREFIKQRSPACRYNRIVGGGGLPDELCWTPPPDVAAEDAVALIDSSTFFDILPGTRVFFDITFQNTTFEPADTAKVFVAFIDVRGEGSAVLDTRQVIIVIPGGNLNQDEFGEDDN
jgi:hypothetical protein